MAVLSAHAEANATVPSSLVHVPVAKPEPGHSPNQSPGKSELPNKQPPQHPTSVSEDFAVGGTTSDQLMGVAESFWKPNMEKDELFETISQCLLSAVDRDCLAGWGGIVHVITPEGVETKHLKGRMD